MRATLDVIGRVAFDIDFRAVQVRGTGARGQEGMELMPAPVAGGMLRGRRDARTPVIHPIKAVLPNLPAYPELVQEFNVAASNSQPTSNPEDDEIFTIIRESMNVRCPVLLVQSLVHCNCKPHVHLWPICRCGRHFAAGTQLAMGQPASGALHVLAAGAHPGVGWMACLLRQLLGNPSCSFGTS